MSSAEQQIAEKAAQVPPGSFRHTVLLAAKRFKSSWVELGKLLAKVRNEALFEEWGYPSFEAYCLSEIRIKKQTAEKLTRSFGFLDRHEPKAMEREDIVETAPPWEVVQVLADAEDRGQLSAQEYKSIRDTIWSNERPVSELKRELEEQFPAPAPAKRDESGEVKRLLSVARKLAADLHGLKKVPKAIAERAEALAGDLEELVAQKDA